MPQGYLVVGIEPRTHLQIPALARSGPVRVADGNDGPVNRSTHPNLAPVFLHAPRGLVEIDFPSNFGQLNRIRLADKTLGQFIEADGERSIFFRLHPGVPAMVKAVDGVMQS